MFLSCMWVLTRSCEACDAVEILGSFRCVSARNHYDLVTSAAWTAFGFVIACGHQLDVSSSVSTVINGSEGSVDLNKRVAHSQDQ